MSDSASDAVNGDVTRAQSGSSSSSRGGKKEKRPNIFKRTGRFIRQIVTELKKVVTPTRKEFGRYVVTVIVFVIVVMAFVLVADWIIKMGADALFG
ncbi:preprotein translocase subunit SecE [Jonesia quinghaiensis]|uniref:preprotein translocase subunit SecE n=1 Tax=Jonesia quinghaiensis TaxID=262806 RepID=UPI0003FC827A|nr:preprotein translocase subunit SecE [Jonesia quinghaiensis]